MLTLQVWEEKRRLKSKSRNPRKILSFMLLPLIIIVLTTVAYALLVDHVNLHVNIGIAEKPKITTSITINAQSNTIQLMVDNITEIINATNPDPLQITINITNTAKTPINKIVLETMLPLNWTWKEEIELQFNDINHVKTPIDLIYCMIEYTPQNNRVLLIIEDLKEAAGTYLKEKESILINFLIEYDLKGQPLPEEYKTIPPTYHVTSTTTAWTATWKSQPLNATATLATYIYWI